MVRAESISTIKADNDIALKDLNLQEYRISELKNFFGERSMNEIIGLGDSMKDSSLSIYEVNQRFPIGCLRCCQNILYSIYKVKEGGYFYVFWIKKAPISFGDANMERASVYFTAYLSDLKKERDFNSIKAGKSTAEDVHSIDPAFELNFMLSSGIYSYSLLDNGDIMRVSYRHSDKMNERQDLVVDGKAVLSKEKSGGYLSHIFMDDLPGQNEKTSALIFGIVVIGMFIIGVLYWKFRRKVN